MSKPFVVACIPAYNEEKNIASVVIKTLRYVDTVVVCDDGSIDLTGEIADRLGTVVIRHKQNLGYGAALKNLFEKALILGAEIIVTLDGDGQHDPSDIPRLVERLKMGDVDIVLGSRFLKKSESKVPHWRKAGIKLITHLASNKELKITDSQSGFRVYKKNVIEKLILTEEGMGISTEILLKADENDFKIIEVPVNISYYKKSLTFNPIVQGLDVIMSTIKYISMRRPLAFYGLPGLFMLCTATLFWVKILNRYTITRSINTNMTLIALSATFVGLSLVTTSIIIWILISVIREKNLKKYV